MNGFDPKSSNVSGQYQQQNQPEKTKNAREINIGGKKASVSKPKKWLRRLISVLFSPGKWLRSSKPKANTASPVRHTPTPENQPAKAAGTPITERTASPVEDSDIKSFINRPLPAPPEPEEPEAKESNRPPVPPRRSKPQPAPRTRPRAQKPQTQTTSPADLTQPDSLEAFSGHFTKGDYLGSDNNTDRNVAKQHLRNFAKDQLRPDNRNEVYKQLPADAKTLVQEVYAEKKVKEELDKLPTGSRQELQALRSKLAKLFKNAAGGKVNQTNQLLVKELDRQLFTAKCSAAYQAANLTPDHLQKQFPNLARREALSTNDERKVFDHYRELRQKDPALTNTFQKNTAQGDAFHTQAIPKYKDIRCDIDSCAGSEGHYVHANYVRLSDAPDEVPDIASQGPTEKNIHHFAHMVNDTDSKLSVCLVSKKELDSKDTSPKKYTISLGPKDVGRTTDYDGVAVKLADQYFIDPDAEGNHNVRIDKLEINGKTHFRVYDTGWEDHTSGTPSRLAALSVLVEQLKQEPELSGSESSPMVVNCNAGVGRTGTFITLSKSTRSYLNSGTVNTDLDPALHKARETRNAFVQTAGQYNVLKALHQDLPAVLDPLINAAGLEIKNPPDQNDTTTGNDETYVNSEAIRKARK
ncbi:protein-tyrosine phosphatase family protein [Endozoicomonas euniceicola]|uniref:Protein-tyrosine-phosphatase n=1 Tax=Endozoicomonas euniceicola TaxID=1234143 RepID=A0ABY6GUQ7_9GAMM|nr:protein-tyrosine phosphatase family protein [Endozoicomonas euniceicola]UYM16503.1 hypothetical protein NX720_00780 [Endozoicomonas euniceicola]